MRLNFSSFEKKEIIKAWLAISLAFGILISRGGLSNLFVNFFISFITVGVGFLLHELAHKYVAQKYRYFAEFRADNKMLLIAIASSFFGFLFAAPGGVIINGTGIDRRKYAKIAGAGPFMNIIIALVFLAVNLSGTGIISFWKVVVFGFVGVLLHDTVVYLAGRYGFVDKFILRKKRKVRHKKKKDWILGLGKGGYILPMVISKFIYGTRVFATLYASQQEKKFTKYFIINVLALLLWFGIMTPIGWYAGRGFTKLLVVVKGVEKALGIIVILIVIYLVIHFISKKFMKKNKK